MTIPIYNSFLRLKNTDKVKKYIPLLVTAFIPLFFLIPVQIKVETPMILAERFFENGGWIEIVILDIYAIILAYVILYKQKIKKIRTLYWSVFSLIFFTQFVLGLLINEKFLMSGDIHLPVPALIIAAPIYRGSRFFMPILVMSTILIVGPAWCSHLCYIGAWDNIISKKRKPKQVNRKFTIIFRYAMLTFVLFLTLLLRYLKVSTIVAFSFALVFGIVGVIIMLLFSFRLGYMFHCTTYCPIGGLVSLVSKIYPARIKIKKSSCTLCNMCSVDCKYDALSVTDIKSGKAGWNCTLCGDCLDSCHSNSLYLSFFNRKKNAWNYYIAIIIGLHAVFLALARL